MEAEFIDFALFIFASFSAFLARTLQVFLHFGTNIANFPSIRRYQRDRQTDRGIGYLLVTIAVLWIFYMIARSVYQIFCKDR